MKEDELALFSIIEELPVSRRRSRFEAGISFWLLMLAALLVLGALACGCSSLKEIARLMVPAPLFPLSLALSALWLAYIHDVSVRLAEADFAEDSVSNC